MLQKNIIENAYTAIIELTEHCDLYDISTCTSLYHLARFIGSAIRDLCSYNTQFDKMYDIITINSARLKKLLPKSIIQQGVKFLHNEPLAVTPITHAYNAISFLICESLKENYNENFLGLHNIARLFVQKRSEYQLWLKLHPNIANYNEIVQFIYETDLKIRRYIYWLEVKIRSNGIKYDKIFEGDDFYAYYYNHQ
ncbi:MAG: hypothetical protein NC452_09575 [Eubacterium sp.]|nr:hypothetical protein [Eubacterium sp.]